MLLLFLIFEVLCFLQSKRNIPPFSPSVSSLYISHHMPEHESKAKLWSLSHWCLKQSRFKEELLNTLFSETETILTSVVIVDDF